MNRDSFFMRSNRLLIYFAKEVILMAVENSIHFWNECRGITSSMKLRSLSSIEIL